MDEKRGVGKNNLETGKPSGGGGGGEDGAVGSADEGVATAEGLLGVEGAEELGEGVAGFAGGLHAESGDLNKPGSDGIETAG